MTMKMMTVMTMMIDKIDEREKKKDILVYWSHKLFGLEYLK